MANPTNREILFIVKLRNDAREAARSLMSDLQGTARAGQDAGAGMLSAGNGMDILRKRASAAVAAFSRVQGLIRDVSAANTELVSTAQGAALALDQETLSAARLRDTLMGDVTEQEAERAVAAPTSGVHADSAAARGGPTSAGVDGVAAAAGARAAQPIEHEAEAAAGATAAAGTAAGADVAVAGAAETVDLAGLGTAAASAQAAIEAVRSALTNMAAVGTEAFAQIVAAATAASEALATEAAAVQTRTASTIGRDGGLALGAAAAQVPATAPPGGVPTPSIEATSTSTPVSAEEAEAVASARIAAAQTAAAAEKVAAFDAAQSVAAAAKIEQDAAVAAYAVAKQAALDKAEVATAAAIQLEAAEATAARNSASATAAAFRDAAAAVSATRAQEAAEAVADADVARTRVIETTATYKTAATDVMTARREAIEAVTLAETSSAQTAVETARIAMREQTQLTVATETATTRIVEEARAAQALAGTIAGEDAAGTIAAGASRADLAAEVGVAAPGAAIPAAVAATAEAPSAAAGASASGVDMAALSASAAAARDAMQSVAAAIEGMSDAGVDAFARLVAAAATASEALAADTAGIRSAPVAGAISQTASTAAAQTSVAAQKAAALDAAQTLSSSAQADAAAAEEAYTSAQEAAVTKARVAKAAALDLAAAEQAAAQASAGVQEAAAVETARTIAAARAAEAADAVQAAEVAEARSIETAAVAKAAIADVVIARQAAAAAITQAEVTVSRVSIETARAAEREQMVLATTTESVTARIVEEARAAQAAGAGTAAPSLAAGVQPVATVAAGAQAPIAEEAVATATPMAAAAMSAQAAMQEVSKSIAAMGDASGEGFTRIIAAASQAAETLTVEAAAAERLQVAPIAAAAGAAREAVAAGGQERALEAVGAAQGGSVAQDATKSLSRPGGVPGAAGEARDAVVSGAPALGAFGDNSAALARTAAAKATAAAEKAAALDAAQTVSAAARSEADAAVAAASEAKAAAVEKAAVAKAAARDLASAERAAAKDGADASKAAARDAAATIAATRAQEAKDAQAAAIAARAQVTQTAATSKAAAADVASARRVAAKAATEAETSVAAVSAETARVAVAQQAALTAAAETAAAGIAKEAQEAARISEMVERSLTNPTRSSLVEGVPNLVGSGTLDVEAGRAKEAFGPSLPISQRGNYTADTHAAAIAANPLSSTATQEAKAAADALASQARKAAEEVAEVGESGFKRFVAAAVSAYDTSRDAVTHWATSAGSSLKSFFSSATGGKAASEAIKDVGKVTEEVTTKAKFGAGAFRELVVIMREFGRGDFSRMAGSASILAQRMGAIELIGVPLLVTLGALAAVAAVVAVGMFQGEKAANTFANTLKLTGNYAGLTADSFEDMAQRIAAATNTSIGSNKDMIQKLANTNQFTSDEIEQLVTSSQEFARATGQDADKVLESFMKMKDGPTKFAEEFSRQYTAVLTPTQVAFIKQLEDTGHSYEALQTLIADVNNGIQQNVEDHTGYIVKAWRNAVNNIKGLWNGLKDLGAGPTKKQEADALDSRAQYLRDNATSDSDFAEADKVQAKADALRNQVADEARVTAERQKQAKIDGEAADAAKDLDSHFGRVGDNAARYRRDVERATNDIQAVLKAGPGKVGYEDALYKSQHMDEVKTDIRKRDMPDAVRQENKDKRAGESAAKKAQREEAERIRQSASDLTSMSKAYDPYLEDQREDASSKDKIIALQKLQITNVKDFQAALQRAGLTQEQFNQLVFQVQNNLDGKDIIKLFQDWGGSVEDMTAKLQKLKDQDTLDKILKAEQAKDGLESVRKILAQLGLDIKDLPEIKRALALGINTEGENDFLKEYLPGFDSLDHAIDKTSRKIDDFYAKLRDAIAAGPAALDQFTSETNRIGHTSYTSDQLRTAATNRETHTTAKSTNDAATAINKVMESRSTLSSEDSKSYQLQQSLLRVEKLRTDGTGNFAAALAQLNITEDQFNDAVARANIEVAGSKDVMGAARAAAQDYVTGVANNGLTMKQVWGNAFSQMSDAIANFVTTGKLNFSSLVRSILADIAKLETQKLFSKGLSAIFGLATGGVSDISGEVSAGLGAQATAGFANFAKTSALPSVSSLLAGVGHSGGLAGLHATMPRTVDASVFDGARRYHVGGIAGNPSGLRSNEVAVVAKENEALMPTARMPDGNFGIKAILPKSLQGGGATGGNTNTIHFAPQLSISVGDIGNQDPNDVGNALGLHVNKALEGLVKRVIVDEMRSGGVLSSSGPRMKF